MAARSWFSVETTHGLSPSEVQLLNRAVRIILFASTKHYADRDLLVRIRQTYRPGMSASDLADAVAEGK
jgi:hypothetical protein